MYCKVDYSECKEWIPGSRCNAIIEKREPAECYELVNNRIARKEVSSNDVKRNK